ncbi:MAG: TonB-dependent receptor [Chloroherpetonaceae bacterium]|nr:TonB-dependent receptor [Chloroherpetonaceae bacterium]
MILFLPIAVLLIGREVVAQTKGGTLRGTVTGVEIYADSIDRYDSTLSRYTRKLAKITRRYPLVGAKVQVKLTPFGGVTDSLGKFKIVGIPRGVYDLLFSAEGYKSHVFKQISVRLDTITEVDNFLVENYNPSSEIVVTANRYEQRLQDISNSISIITQDFIENRNSISIDDALRYVPGVNFSNANVNIRSSSGVSFGIGSRVLTLIDNIPVMGPAEGDSKWDFFPTDFIDRVEIIKGPSSSLYGSSALGGVINLITRADYTPKTNITLYGGLYDGPRFESWNWANRTPLQSGLEIAHSNNFGRLSVYGSISRRYDDGYRENADFSRWRLFSKINYQLSDRESLSLLATFAEERRGNALFWESLDAPYRDGLNDIDLNGNSIFSSLYSDKLLFSPIYSLKFSKTGELNWRNRYFQTKFFDSEGVSSNALQAGTEFQTTFSFARGFAVTMGAEGSYSNVESTIFGNHRSLGFGGYLQGDIPLNIFIISYGVRYDGLRIDDGEWNGQFSPRAGVNGAVTENISLRFSLGRGFRNASISERFTVASAGALQIDPNPELQAESSTSFEGGLLFSNSNPIEFFGIIKLERYNVDASLFFTTYANLIEPRPAIQGSSGLRPRFTFQNITDAEILGTEIFFHSEYNRKSFELDVSYTHTNPRDLSNGGWLRYRNRRLFYVTARAHLSLISIEWNYRFISRFEANEPILNAIIPDAEATSDAHVNDFRLSAQTGIGMFSLILRNAFNVAYVEQPALIASPRNIVLQFRTSF